MNDWRTNLIDPVVRGVRRLFRPEVRIVTGGVAFYALFSIFPLIYLTLTLLSVFLPGDIAAELKNLISNLFAQSVEPLTGGEIETIREMTPAGLSLRAFLALVLVLITATSGAKAAITGIRMIAGSEARARFVRFQGVSLLMTGSLVLMVWLLGALQLMVTVVSQAGGQLAGDIARLADTLWISKGIASFAVFYMILALSLRGHLRKGKRAIAAGAGAGAVAFLFVTFLFQLYLNYSVLGTLYGALASVILGFIWLSASVMSLLLGAALATEFSQAWGEDAPA